MLFSVSDKLGLFYLLLMILPSPVKKIKCLACMISAFNTASMSFVAASSVRPSTELQQLAAFISAFINISATSVHVVYPQEGCQVYQQLNKESKITRGHNYTLVKKQSRLDVRKFSFSQRTINIWNNLSTDCVHASSVNMFKNKIDKYLVKAGYT